MPSVSRTVEVGILNVAANPHPDGIYNLIFQKMANFSAATRGSDFAKITLPKQEKEEFLIGRILIWTEIDPDQPWLNLLYDEVISISDENEIKIPTYARPNYRTFNYVFNISNHNLFIETRNELNHRFSIRTALKFFQRLLTKCLPSLPTGLDAEISVVPDSSALEKIRLVPGLRKLTIRIVRPNGDTSDDGPERVLRQMKESRTQQQTIEYIKEAGATKLEINDEMSANMEASQSNGFTRAEGRDLSGRKIFQSTDEIPKQFIIDQDNGDNFFGRLMANSRKFG
jgi:hypothetical protein